MLIVLRDGFTPQLSPADACMQIYYFIGVSRRTDKDISSIYLHAHLLERSCIEGDIICMKPEGDFVGLRQSCSETYVTSQDTANPA